MSIINEALKKTQTRLESTKKIFKQNAVQPIQKEGPSKEAPLKENHPKEKTAWLWITVSVIIISFLGSAVVFALFITSENRLTTKPPAIEVKELKPAEQKPVTTAVPKRSPAKKKSELGLVLNGIITTGKDNTALINDSIYKVGDEIDGIRITKITAEKVEVLYKGKFYTLTTK